MAYDQAYLPPYQQSFLMPQAVYHDPYYTDENTFFMSSTDASISDHQHSKIVEEDAEDEDTASRPRLSPEQLAILEDHFQSHHKPNTDFKKQLAEQLGLSLARVNNWYQNRRAKQRHQRPQTRRYDVFPSDSNGLWLQPVHNAVGAQELPQSSGPMVDQVPILSSTALFGEHNMDQSLSGFGEMMVPNDDEEVVPASTNLPGMDFGPNLMDVTFPPLPDSPDLDLLSLDTEQEQKHFLGTEGSAAPSLYCLTQPLYHNTNVGVPLRNVSAQSLSTFDSSPDDTHPNFITPPEKPSPISFVALDEMHRRPSVTSDITSNLDHIQLRHQQSGHELSKQVSNSSMDGLSVHPANFPSAPPKLEITAEQFMSDENAGKMATRTSSAPNIDLASRRKRPRPAALRPEVHRSHSYAGPSTMSPTTRTPSLLSVDSPSVRRMRSAGQNLNISSGRIVKPGTIASQLSPRNLQSCVEGAMSTKSLSTTPRPEATARPLTPQTSESFPTSAAALTSANAGIGYPSQQLTEAGMFIQSPPITPFGASQNPFEFPTVQHIACGVPPQSAPPTRTMFFQDSPSVGPQQPYPGPAGWQGSEDMPSGPPGIIMPEHGFYHHRHSHSQSPPQLAQDIRLPYDMPQPMFYGSSQQSSLSMPPPISSQFYEAPAPPQPPKDLEIQVTTIPQPKGPIQGPRTFTFSNVTPKDFNNPPNGNSNDTAVR